MRKRGDLTGNRMIFRHKKVMTSRFRGVGGAGVRQNEAGEAPGERGFAYSRRPADDQGMRQMAGEIGLKQLAFRLGMAENAKGLARMRRVVEAVGLRRSFCGTWRHRFSHCLPVGPPLKPVASPK